MPTKEPSSFRAGSVSGRKSPFIEINDYYTKKISKQRFLNRKEKA
jgi:hypothetical protein